MISASIYLPGTKKIFQTIHLSRNKKETDLIQTNLKRVKLETIKSSLKSNQHLKIASRKVNYFCFCNWWENTEFPDEVPVDYQSFYSAVNNFLLKMFNKFLISKTLYWSMWNLNNFLVDRLIGWDFHVFFIVLCKIICLLSVYWPCHFKTNIYHFCRLVLPFLNKTTNYIFSISRIEPLWFSFLAVHSVELFFKDAVWSLENFTLINFCYYFNFNIANNFKVHLKVLKQYKFYIS